MEKGTRRPFWTVQGCGTSAAAQRHIKYGEPMDDACREARNAEKRRRANPTGRTRSEAQKARRARERESKQNTLQKVVSAFRAYGWHLWSVPPYYYATTSTQGRFTGLPETLWSDSPLSLLLKVSDRIHSKSQR